MLEPLAGYLLIGQNLIDEPQWAGQAWNFGPEPSGHISVGELVTARRIQHEAFGGDADEVEIAQAEDDFGAEGIAGSTFLAFVDGSPVAAGYASYTPLGLLLFGGATLPSARGRGAYRSLVVPRA